MESCFNRNLGCIVNSRDNNSTFRKDSFWFGEGQSRVVVSVNKDHLVDFHTAFITDIYPTQMMFLGTVTNNEIKIEGEDFGSIYLWKNLYDTAIEKYFTKIILD